ncbi:hypothetical protein X801_01500, partial [Opisthorchis viverrini]
YVNSNENRHTTTHSFGANCQLPEKDVPSRSKRPSDSREFQQELGLEKSFIEEMETRDLCSRLEQMRPRLTCETTPDPVEMEHDTRTKFTSPTDFAYLDHFLSSVQTKVNPPITLQKSTTVSRSSNPLSSDVRDPPRVPDPSTDILAQWRLRRRIEAAQKAIDPSFQWSGLPVQMPHTGHQTPLPSNTPYLTGTFNSPFHQSFCAPYQIPAAHCTVGTQTTHTPGRVDQVNSASQTDEPSRSDNQALLLSCRDVAVLAVDVSKSTTDSSTSPDKTEQRSVRIMVVPCRRDAQVQTSSDCASNDTQPRLTRDTLKAWSNVHHVHVTRKDEQHSTPVLPHTSNDRRPEFHNTFLLDSILDSESARRTETGSGWQVSSLPSTPSPIPFVNPNLSTFGDRASAVDCVLCAETASRVPPQTGVPTHPPVVHINDKETVTPTFEFPLGALRDRISMSIIQYLEQTVNSASVLSKFPNDRLLRDLCHSRSDRLEQMRLVRNECLAVS